jgi:hypothetical protein
VFPWLSLVYRHIFAKLPVTPLKPLNHKLQALLTRFEGCISSLLLPCMLHSQSANAHTLAGTSTHTLVLMELGRPPAIKSSTKPQASRPSGALPSIPSAIPPPEPEVRSAEMKTPSTVTSQNTLSSVFHD